MKKESIILIGGGGHCKSCIDVIELQDKYVITGIIDVKHKVGEMILNYPVIGCDEDLLELSKENDNYLITIGQIITPEKRITIYNRLKEMGVKTPVIVSPLAYVSKHSLIGEGTIVMHGAIINANVKIGQNCIINTKALIEHDAIIGNNCHISTASVVNGGVEIGEGTFYGSGAVSKEYVKIPNFSFIKANSIVKE